MILTLSFHFRRVKWKCEMILTLSFHFLSFSFCQPSQAAKEANERMELSSDDEEDMEEHDADWDDKEDSNDEAPQQNARSLPCCI